VQRLVFGAASPEIAAAAEYAIRVAVTRYLGDLLSLDAVRVTVAEATLSIDILYTIIGTGEERADSFSRPLQGTP
jgi:hypothetical protein